MWIGIIAAAAFCTGFLLASLLACGKTADEEMRRIRKSMFSRGDLDSVTGTGGPGRRLVTPSPQANSAYNGLDVKTAETGRVPAVNIMRRVEAT